MSDFCSDLESIFEGESEHGSYSGSRLSSRMERERDFMEREREQMEREREQMEKEREYLEE